MIHRIRRSKVTVALFVGALLVVAVFAFSSWQNALSQTAKSKPAKENDTNASVEVIMTKEDLEAAEKSLAELDFTDESSEAAQSQAEL